jgi:hypothetical protein
VSDERDPVEAAQSMFVEIILPGPSELFLDFDTTEAVEQFRKRFEVFVQMEPNAEWSWRRSRTKISGRHVRVTLGRPTASPTERVMLQAMLGSDPVRELLALKRIRENAPVIDCLFRARSLCKVHDDCKAAATSGEPNRVAMAAACFREQWFAPDWWALLRGEEGLSIQPTDSLSPMDEVA